MEHTLPLPVFLLVRLGAYSRHLSFYSSDAWMEHISATCLFIPLTWKHSCHLSFYLLELEPIPATCLSIGQTLKSLNPWIWIWITKSLNLNHRSTASESLNHRTTEFWIIKKSPVTQQQLSSDSAVTQQWLVAPVCLPGSHICVRPQFSVSGKHSQLLFLVEKPGETIIKSIIIR